MTETLACHHILNIIDEIIGIEGNQLLSLHEIADRHTLVNETGCRVGIVRSCDDSTAALLCQFLIVMETPAPSHTMIQLAPISIAHSWDS